jgi:hypothetical protein
VDAKLAVGLVAGALLLGTYYVEHRLESDTQLPAEYQNGPEALRWLKSNRSESALGSNRFGETHNAIRFVEQLYDAGARRVIIPQDAIFQDDVETYADAIVVTLPDDPTSRDRVWRICAREIERETGESAGSPTESQVFLWWD